MQKLINCPICNVQYLDGGLNKTCPKCSGRKGGEERILIDESKETFGVKKQFDDLSLQKDLSNVSFGNICGWLVCSKGNKKGCFYKLFQMKNSVCSADGGFDREYIDSARVLYDHVEKKFWIINGLGKIMVRLNGKLLLNAIEIVKGDIIQIGDFEFTFIPLCNEKFMW